jgi:hypothetical protein
MVKKKTEVPDATYTDIPTMILELESCGWAARTPNALYMDALRAFTTDRKKDNYAAVVPLVRLLNTLCVLNGLDRADQQTMLTAYYIRQQAVEAVVDQVQKNCDVTERSLSTYTLPQQQRLWDQTIDGLKTHYHRYGIDIDKSTHYSILDGMDEPEMDFDGGVAES